MNLRSRTAAHGFLLTALLASACAVQTEGDELSPEPSIVVAQLEAAAGSASPSKSAAFQRLDLAMPTWSPERIARQPATQVWMAPERPRESAAQFTQESLSFVERRAGKDYYASATGAAVTFSDQKRGAWSFLRAASSLPQGVNAFPKEQARATAQSIFAQVGLPEGEQDNVRTPNLIVGSPTSGEKRIVARHVRFHRTINGLRVRDSLFMVTFDLTGTPYRVEGEWPPFVLAKSNRLHTRQEALDVLSDKVSERIAKPDTIADVKVDLSYQPSENGTFEPIISVWIFAADGVGSPQLTEYSLVSGLRAEPSDSPSDPSTDG